MTMNENQSLAFVRETDSMDFVSKEIYELKDSSWDIGEEKGSDEHRNHKLLNELSMDGVNEMVDSPRKQSEDGHQHNTICRDKDANSISSDRFDTETEQRSQGHECLMTFEESTDLFPTEAVDKSVLDFESPELYKEINSQQTVKDICVDEGNPEKGRILTERVKEESFNAEIIASVDKEILASVKEEILLVKMDNDSTADQQCSEVQKAMASATDVSECCHIQGSDPAGEANFSPTGKTATIDSSEEKSFTDEKISEEFKKPQNILRSLLKPLDGEEIAVKQWPPEISDEEAVSQSLAVAFANEEVQQEVVLSGTKSGTNEDDVKEPSVDVSNKDKNEGNLPNDKSHDVSDKDENKDNILDNKARDIPSNHPVQLGNAQTVEADAPKLSSHDLSGNNLLQLSNAQTVEADAPKHDRWISSDTSVVARMPKDDGETSFSAASLINYAEPVPFSGSLSHRSDSSATSARSFAFPVLQSEWNSSPVRMAKANRKHRCWSSGLFCCRF